jgi:hypothetical protein
MSGDVNGAGASRTSDAAIALMRIGLACPPVPLRACGERVHSRQGWTLATGKEPCARVLRRVCGSGRTGDLEPSEAQVRRWFEIEPTAGLGAFIPARLIVLDLELPAEQLGVLLPQTPCVRTNRGVHAWFRNTGNLLPSALYLGSDKVGELRTSRKGRQYVVVPPTVVAAVERRWEVAPEGLGLEPAAAFADFADFDLQGLSINQRTGARGHSRRAAETESKQREILQGSSRLVKAESAAAGEALLRPLGPLPPHEASEERAAWFARSQSELPFVQAQAAVLGIDFRGLDENFLCVLHSENNPSACLTRAGNETIVYRDFHSQGSGNEYMSLPDVRASLAYGRLVRPKRVERMLWMLILLVQAGLVEPAAVPLPDLPPGAPEFARTAYSKLSLFLGARWLNANDEGQPFPLAVRLRHALFGLSHPQCKQAMEYFLQHGILKQEPRGPGRRASSVYSIPTDHREIPASQSLNDELHAHVNRVQTTRSHHQEVQPA